MSSVIIILSARTGPCRVAFCTPCKGRCRAEEGVGADDGVEGIPQVLEAERENGNGAPTPTARGEVISLSQKIFFQYGLYIDLTQPSYSAKEKLDRLRAGIVLNDYPAWAILKGGLSNTTRGEAFPADSTNRAITRLLRESRQGRQILG